jgi:HK97 family phage portal protein
MGVWSAVRGLFGNSTERVEAPSAPETRSASLEALIRAQAGMFGSVPGTRFPITGRTADSHSAVWRAKMLRANLISSIPYSVVRVIGDVPYDVPLPRSLTTPWPSNISGRPEYRFDQFLWSSQWDLDTYGNTFSIVHARDAFGLPSVVEPVPMDYVSISMIGRFIREIRIDGYHVDIKNLLIESQYRLHGYDLGMSPVRYATMAIGAFLAAQYSAQDWFERRRMMPNVTLKNTEVESFTPEKVEEIKMAWNMAMESGQLFVTGSDWTWEATKVTREDAGFLEAMEAGIADIARFFDVPASMLGGGGQSGTYSNVTQQQLQLLVNHLGPTIQRREKTFSTWLPKPRLFRFDTQSLLRMDPEQQSRIFGSGITSRYITPNEVRAKMGMPPLTPEQIGEFSELFPARAPVAMTPEKGEKLWM